MPSTIYRVLFITPAFVASLATAPAMARVLSASSCAQINQRISEAAPGDEVVVMSGTYTDCRINVRSASGTESAPITLRADSVGSVTFTGNRTSLLVTRNRWIVQGFVWKAISPESEAALRFVGCDHVVVLRNTFIDCSAGRFDSGRFVHYSSNASGNVFERNEVYSTGRRTTNAYWLILTATNYPSLDVVTDTIIRYNYIHDIIIGVGAGYIFNLGANGNSVYETRTRVERNLFEDTVAPMHIKSSNNFFVANTMRRANGLDVRTGAYNEFTDNYLLELNTRACQMCANVQGFSLTGTGNVIQNNYVEGGDQGVDLMWGQKLFPANLWLSVASRNTSWAALESDISNNTFIGTRVRTFSARGTRYDNWEWWPGITSDIPPAGNNFSRNIVVNTEGVAIVMDGLVEQNWSENVVFSTPPGTPGDVRPGLERVDPRMAADADGILVSTRFSDRGAHPTCPPITPADVGPGSTYTGCNSTVANMPPVVNAGPSRAVPLSVMLAGAVTDDGLPAGEALTSEWMLVDGPGVAMFVDATSPTTAVTFSNSGIYTLRLSASDGELSSSDNVVLAVDVPGEDLRIPLTMTSPTIDGSVDDVWDMVPDESISRLYGTGAQADPRDHSAVFRMLWDIDNLYVLIRVTDDIAVLDSTAPWQDDSATLRIDANNDKMTSYGTDDGNFVFRREDPGVVSGEWDAGVVVFAQTEVPGGYVFEAAVPWDAVGQVERAPMSRFGLEILSNDDDDGGDNDQTLSWYTNDPNTWKDPSLFGTAILVGEFDSSRSDDGATLGADDGSVSGADDGGVSGADDGGVPGADDGGVPPHRDMDGSGPGCGCSLGARDVRRGGHTGVLGLFLLGSFFLRRRWRGSSRE